MKKEDIRLLIQQLYDLPGGVTGQRHLVLAEAALFVEETFNLTLADKEISLENLSTLEKMESFILKRFNED
jgi:hypothetical protein